MILDNIWFIYLSVWSITKEMWSTTLLALCVVKLSDLWFCCKENWQCITGCHGILLSCNCVLTTWYILINTNVEDPVMRLHLHVMVMSLLFLFPNKLRSIKHSAISHVVFLTTTWSMPVVCHQGIHMYYGLWFPTICLAVEYSISQEICTRFCCALLRCGYAIVHNEFTWSIYPYSSGLLCWHWGNR